MFEKHPEYYSLIDGKRQIGWSQLCLTNPEVVHIVTERVLEAIRRDPTAKLFSVSQNDWDGHCQCESCMAIEKREDSPAGTLIHFVNQVAEQVEKEFPNVWIETLAYQYTRKPPKTIRPRHNVVPLPLHHRMRLLTAARQKSLSAERAIRRAHPRLVGHHRQVVRVGLHDELPQLRGTSPELPRDPREYPLLSRQPRGRAPQNRAQRRTACRVWRAAFVAHRQTAVEPGSPRRASTGRFLRRVLRKRRRSYSRVFQRAADLGSGSRRAGPDLRCTPGQVADDGVRGACRATVGPGHRTGSGRCRPPLPGSHERHPGAVGQTEAYGRAGADLPGARRAVSPPDSRSQVR